MPSGKSLRRKLDNKIIKRFGFETTLKRPRADEEFDGYGEPTQTPWVFDESTIKIVIDQDRRYQDETEIGGLPNDKKERIWFYVKGNEDVRIGDHVIYPVESDNGWQIEFMEPNVFKGINVINECRAVRDSRV